MLQSVVEPHLEAQGDGTCARRQICSPHAAHTSWQGRMMVLTPRPVQRVRTALPVPSVGGLTIAELRREAG